MHLEERCETPTSRKLNVVGALWACDCGQVWRRICRGGYDGYFWTWEKFDALK